MGSHNSGLWNDKKNKDVSVQCNKLLINLTLNVKSINDYAII